jgi:hypothetical protein
MEIADRIRLEPLTAAHAAELFAALAHPAIYTYISDQHGVAYNENLETTGPAIEKFFAKYLKPKL